ncbi:MAG: NusG domain II-containing protein [bacterium]
MRSLGAHTNAQARVTGAARRGPTLGDAFVIAILLGAGIASAVVFARAPAGAVASIRVAAARSERYRLDESRTLRLPGPLGETEIVISDGAARIVASPCARKVCVRMGAARRVGQTIVCVPNRVIVRIESEAGSPEEFDAILR